MKLTDSFSAALTTLPRPGGNGYHTRLLGVANIGIQSGLPPDEVAAAIRTHTPPGTRCVPDREIADAVSKAMDGKADAHRPRVIPRWRVPRPAVRTFDAAGFMAGRVAEGDGVGEADILEA